MPDYLDRRDAAYYLTKRGFKVSYNTLQKWATVGGGPPYRIFGGRALYTAADLDEWAEAKCSPVKLSSSDVASADVPRIEITPEMVEAGCEAMTLMGGATPGDVVSEVFRAMAVARLA
jgi:hypothetical protein